MKHSTRGRFLSMLLVLAMVFSVMPLGVFAAKGDQSNVSTGLTGNIDTSDTISLPIKILDYENDGMLFEYAESKETKSAEDFGSKYYYDFTGLTSTTTKDGVAAATSTSIINHWSDVSLEIKTGTYANYVRMTYVGKTNANWTGNRAGVLLTDFTTSSTITTDQIQYMVIVYRSNIRSGSFRVGLNRANLNGAGEDGNYTNDYTITTENDTYWTYAVLDLQNGTLGSNWDKGAVYGIYAGLPLDASGEWMDIAHVAYFSDEDCAKAFGEYALTDGSDRGDNRAFGLLRGSRSETDSDSVTYPSNFLGIHQYFTTDNYPHKDDEYNGEKDTFWQINTNNAYTLADHSGISNTIGYQLFGTFKGIANLGLLESTLGANGPVYKEETVEYLANLLKASLEIPERNSDGWKNYRYVKGTASIKEEDGNYIDLATALRTRITDGLGSYTESSAKKLVGTWSEVEKNIKTCFDAAYFLLNSIFVEGSYNAPQSNYNYLVLSAGIDTETGNKVYVFDGGFTDSATPSSAKTAVKYDTDNKTIQNSSAAGKTQFVFQVDGTTESKTTLNPFLPIRGKENVQKQTATTYYQDPGVINTVNKQEGQDTLYNRNYNFALVSEGTFVYHANDELFFDFEGDDDVYLFINDELVMDIGSAHSIDSVRFNLNDYVNAAKAGTLGSENRNKNLNLAEGQVCTFKFYYMERHSYGSNMRIMTNIRVTDPKIEPEKTAWQDGDEIAYGGIIDEKKIVEYGFSIKNTGDVALYNLTFEDNDIGVKLDYDRGLAVTGERVYNLKGETLKVTDLTAVVSADGYETVEVKFADNEALKAFLKDFTATGLESGGGLFKGATVMIRGIGYMLSDDEIEATVFDNSVDVTATNKEGNITLRASDNMRVFVPSDPMYYQWAKHELVVTKNKFIEDVTAAASNVNNPLYDKDNKLNLTVDNVTKLEIVSKNGDAAPNDYVTIADDNSITINYPTARSYVFYVKVTYDGDKTLIVPVLVNVTDVENSYIVLDYGLPVKIKIDDIGKNDTLTVTGRDTKSSIIAIGGLDENGKNGSYADNEISFTSATGNKIEGTYGTFEFADGTITYTPTSFIEGEDSIQIALNVYECENPSNITGTLNINKEVEMYKTITIIPATVMYYEDNFTSMDDNDNNIKYSTSNIEVIKSDSDKSYIQSADQTEVYGHDDVYAKDGNTTVSGGTANKIKLDGTDLLNFTFSGTGFELIARTNATDTGSMIVKTVKATVEIETETDGHAKGRSAGKVDKVTIPVIMEFDNGNNGGTEAIYQVPVVRVDNLNYNRYKVTVKGVQAYDYSGEKIEKDTYLYFDGLRIYNPCADKYYDKYLSTEANAEFVELRDAIIDCYAGAVQYTENGNLLVSTGTTTWAENLVGTYEEFTSGTKPSYTSYAATSVDDYLFRGPNNEVYMIGQSSQTTEDKTKVDNGSAVVFYVKETGETTDPHSLQIALRAVDLGTAFGTASTGMETVIQYGVANTDTDGTLGWTPLVTTSSGTEQYYTIDYKNCVKVDGAYQIVVKVDTGMVSYSSLKLVGLELVDLGETLLKDEGTTLSYKQGFIFIENGGTGLEEKAEEGSAETTAYNMLLSVSRQMSSTIMMTPNGTIIINPTEPELPDESDKDDGEVGEPKYDSVVPILDVLTLTVRAGEGGSISPEGDLYIAFGAGRTFKITADEGYEIEDVLVNGKSVGAVEKYTIKAATANTTVEAKFRKIG